MTTHPATPAALQPADEQVVGVCPGCGGPLVRIARRRGGVGTVAAAECWDGLGDGLGCRGGKESK